MFALKKVGVHSVGRKEERKRKGRFLIYDDVWMCGCDGLSLDRPKRIHANAICQKTHLMPATG